MLGTDVLIVIFLLAVAEVDGLPKAILYVYSSSSLFQRRVNQYMSDGKSMAPPVSVEQLGLRVNASMALGAMNGSLILNGESQELRGVLLDSE